VLLGEFDNLGERFGIVDRDLGQAFAVEFDIGPRQRADEQAIANTAHPAGGADASDPKPAKHALADAAVAEGITPGADQRDNRLPIKMMAAGAKAFGQLAGAFATLRQCFAAACTNHDPTPPSSVGQAFQPDDSYPNVKLESLTYALADGLDILLRHFADFDNRPAKVAFALAGFMTVQVFLAGRNALELAARRHFEALLRGLMRLHLGHETTPQTEKLSATILVAKREYHRNPAHLWPRGGDKINRKRQSPRRSLQFPEHNPG